MSPARIVGAGHALPAPMDQQGLWEGYFARHHAGSRAAARVWAASGVEVRHGVVDPRWVDVAGWGTEARMLRYAEEALPLGAVAVKDALDAAGVCADEVGLLALVSCTGYGTPGVDIRLADQLGMAADTQRLVVGHMGCYAALPGLGVAADYVAARRRTAVLLCLELPSLHVQPATDDMQQVVAHALFGDAAAALVVRPDGPGWEVVDTVARTDPATGDHMRWDVTDLGFRMGLSPRVPDVLARHVRPVVTELLARHGLGIDDVGGWAVHPGGRRILEVVGERLGLADGALSASYDVLRECGNCSSATVLLVLERLARPAPGGYAVAMAFGPGLTLWAALLRSAG